LLSDNIHDLKSEQIEEQKESVQHRLTEEVGQEKNQNRTSEAAQAQLAADRDVMALLTHIPHPQLAHRRIEGGKVNHLRASLSKNTQ